LKPGVGNERPTLLNVPARNVMSTRYAKRMPTARDVLRPSRRALKSLIKTGSYKWRPDRDLVKNRLTASVVILCTTA